MARRSFVQHPMNVSCASRGSASRKLALLVFGVALQSCATAGAVPASAPPPTDAPRPGEGASPVMLGVAADGTPRAEAARSPPAPAPEKPDDPEIEARVEEDSRALQQVHDAELNAELTQEPPAHAAAGIPALPELQRDLAALQAEYDIPIVVNEAVVRCVRLFQSPQVRPHFLRWLSRAQRYAPRFREILRREGLPEDTVFVAMVESGFGTRATSRASAVGPWQFVAATGKRYGLRRDRWIDERRDPEKSTRAAARFLKELHRETADWHLAWASYNAGPRRVARARSHGYEGFWEMARAKVLPGETRAYVPAIIAAAIVTKHAAAFGFADEEIEPLRWVAYEEVVVPRTTPLALLAKGAGVALDELLDLNPELRRTHTPPRRYALKIPRAQATVFAERWPRVKAGAALAARKARAADRSRTSVRVRRGDSLWKLARLHGVTVQELAAWNGIREGRQDELRAGRVLRVR